MASPIRFALLGCGTVGSGVVELTTRNASYLATRVGAPLELVHVVVRDPKKARKVDRVLGEKVTTDVAKVLADESIDVFVEVVGGVSPAGEWIEAALRRGKSVVTANK